MSTINFRLYGEQLFGFTNKYLTEYITPDIEKEEFLTTFKNGLVTLNEVKSKKSIIFSPQMTLEKFSMGELKLTIPDETGNFCISSNDIKLEISLNNIKDEDIEKILISEKKNLIENFMDYAIKKIEKKDNESSFIGNLMQSLVNRALDDLMVELNKLELKVKFESKCIVFKIDKINYSEKDGIILNNISFLYEGDSDKLNIIDKFDVIIHFEKNEENSNNKLNIEISEFKFELNQNLYIFFNEIFHLFQNTNYKKIYIKYKQLIQFHKPKIKETDSKSDKYRKLWFYAIKSVIKLNKYIGHDKQDIFDLFDITQNKIIKKYLKDKSETENIILTDDFNVLKATKESVEQKVIDNKKGSSIMKSFSFFFGGGNNDDDEKKNELTDEEKEISNKIYSKEEILNFLTGKLLLDNMNKFPLVDKIKNFFSKISFVFIIKKLELILNDLNFKKKENLYISDINLNINYTNEKFDFTFGINDIGCKDNESIFKCNNNPNNKKSIELLRDENNKISLLFNFDNIELNEDLFLFIINFNKSIKIKKIQKIFHSKKYVDIISKENINDIMNQIENFSLINNFKLPNIPSLSLKNNNNKIDFDIIDYSLSNDSIHFNLNIKDNYCNILEKYPFTIKTTNKNYLLDCENEINIILSPMSSKYLLISYLKFENITKNNRKNYSNKVKNDFLFGFNYVFNQKIDLSNFDIDNIGIKLTFNKLNIKIFEENEKYLSELILDKFSFLYEKKCLKINLNKFSLSTNLMSSLVLYLLLFESPIFEQYKNLFEVSNNDSINIINTNENKNNDIINNEIQSNENNEATVTFNYMQIINEILVSFEFNLNTFNFIFNANDNITSFNLYEIKCGKKEDNLECFINKINFIINKSNKIFNENNENSSNIKDENNNSKNIALFEINEITKVVYELKNDFLKSKMQKLIFNINSNSANLIWDSYGYLIKQIDWDIIICKFNLDVDEIEVLFNQFLYTAKNIYSTNFSKSNINNDSIYLTINNFEMKNESKKVLIHEKELKLKYVFTSKYENNIEIIETQLDIKISQHDISYLILLLQNQENNKNNEYKKFNSNKMAKSENVGLLNNNSILNNENNNLNRMTTINLDTKNVFKSFTFTLKFILPKINLCFCLNDYTKISEVSIINSLFNIKYDLYESEIKQNQLSYEILLGKITYKYFDFGNNEIVILNYGKTDCNINEDSNNNKKDDNNKNNIIKCKNDFIDQSQMIIIFNDKGYKIKLNQNQIIVRIDLFLLIYYYFKGAIPLDEMIDVGKKQIEEPKKIIQIETNINDSKFQLQTSYDNKENFHLDIDKFYFLYSSTLSQKFPYGNIVMTLSRIGASIMSNKNSRKFFFTRNNFLAVNLHFEEGLLNGNIIMDYLSINLAYTDIISFLNVYSLNKMFYQKVQEKSELFLKNIELNKNKKCNDSNKKNYSNNIITPQNKSITFTGQIEFEELNITLIDNSKENYHPFLNIKLDKIFAIVSPDKSIDSSSLIYISSYNYISGIWEPTLENTLIKYQLKYANNSDDKETTINGKAIIDKMNINLSDMSISFALLIFRNWIYKFQDEIKKLEEREEKILNKVVEFAEEKTKIVKITNNKLVNYTGNIINYKYNGKEYKLKNLKEVNLDYINDWDSIKYGPKHIILIFEGKEYKIPIEKLVTLGFNSESGNKIIVENTLSADRSINIKLYSSIIFTNKTIYSIQVKIENKKIGKMIFCLNTNEVFGVPFPLINKNSTFNLMIIKKSSNKSKEDDVKETCSLNYNFSDFIDLSMDKSFQRRMKLGDKVLSLNLDRTIKNVRSLVIFSEFSIINCLPCELVVWTYHKKSITIKTCHQYYVNFSFDNSLVIKFEIKTGRGSFYSKLIDLLTLDDNSDEHGYLLFQNVDGYSLKLMYCFKKTTNEKTLIVYAEAIISNKSSIQLIVDSTYNNKNFCYNISDNTYLVSAKIDYKFSWIQLINEKFISKRLNLEELMETPIYNVKLSGDDLGNAQNASSLSLLIQNKLSFMNIVNNPNFDEKIMSIVYSILPTCRITNLLPNNQVIIFDYLNRKNNYGIFPLTQIDFHYFYKGQNVALGIAVMNLKTKTFKSIVQFNLGNDFKTLTIDDVTLNIDIKKDPETGVYYIFIVESTFENSKVIMENLTNEEIIVYQKCFEKSKQILGGKKKEILKIYDIYNTTFYFEVNKKRVEMKISTITEESKYIKIGDKILLSVESNGIKLKITFYYISEFNSLKTTITTIFNNININDIYISMISDNEDKIKKVEEYQRCELLLLNFRSVNFAVKIEHSSGVLNKVNISSTTNINDFAVYNQLKDEVKFPCVLSNRLIQDNPFANICNEINFFKSSNIAILSKTDYKIGKLQLSIEPEFMMQYLNFIDNICYRMEISDFNIDEIFLSKNKNEEIKDFLEDYRNSSFLLYVKKFNFPTLRIKFELIEKSLKKLLKERIGCSSFNIWLAQGLTRRRHTINLLPNNNNYPYLGSVYYFLYSLYTDYKANLVDNLTKMGIQGFLGQVKSLFIEENDKNYADVIRKRCRNRRAFYGKFKYFKSYNEVDAVYVNHLIQYDMFKSNFYIVNLIQSSKIIFVFTEVNLALIDSKSNLLKMIDYFYVKKAKNDGNIMIVEYNQIIDNENKCQITCDNEITAQKVTEILNEESSKNSERFFEI